MTGKHKIAQECVRSRSTFHEIYRKQSEAGCDRAARHQEECPAVKEGEKAEEGEEEKERDRSMCYR